MQIQICTSAQPMIFLPNSSIYIQWNPNLYLSQPHDFSAYFLHIYIDKSKSVLRLSPIIFLPNLSIYIQQNPNLYFSQPHNFSVHFLHIYIWQENYEAEKWGAKWGQDFMTTNGDSVQPMLLGIVMRCQNQKMNAKSVSVLPEWRLLKEKQLQTWRVISSR